MRASSPPVPPDYRNAANRDAWAIGQSCAQGFSVRRIVWGRLMAQCEKREGEQIRRARILVKRMKKPELAKRRRPPPVKQPTVP